jgi:hypothetical protein
MTNNGSTAPRDPRARAAVGSLAQRADHTVIESLDTVLLFLADLGVGFDNVPELDDVILNPLNVD